MTLYRYRRSLYRYVRDGCATGSKACPNVDPIAAVQLDSRGGERPGGAMCIDRSQAEEVPDDGPH